MGLALIALGTVMSISLFTHVNVLKTIMTFWPAVLILLGVEIFLHLFVKRGADADMKIRYDVLSIIFIGFILAVSVCFYAVTLGLELFDSRADMYVAFGIKNEDVYFESGPVELADANEIVLFNGFSSVKVLSTNADSIRIDYKIAANSNDREYAEDMLKKVVQIEPGERTYMMSNADMFYSNRKMSRPTVSCLIYLPEDKLLDISDFWGRFECDSALENQIIDVVEKGPPGPGYKPIAY